MIAIVEYEGNLRSVQKGFESVGARAVITSERETLLNADAIVLPGQGAFGTTMERLNSTGVADTVREAIGRGTPYLGICIGLQVLFERSEEAPGTPGLGVLRGSVARFGTGMKVPHMGWNQLQFRRKPPPFERVDDGSFVYFVHSYFAVPDDESIVAATTDYGVEFVSAVRRDNIYATQFHPEKSQSIGLSVLRSFAQIVSARR